MRGGKREGAGRPKKPEDEKAKITKIYSNFAESLRSAGLPDLADRFAMTGKDDAITKASASIYTKIDIPVQAKFSAFSRNLLTLDFFKRKADINIYINKITAKTIFEIIFEVLTPYGTSVITMQLCP